MHIREARPSDLDAVIAVETAAFGTDEEAELVRALLLDASAQPALSLIATEDDGVVGHILFTRAHLQPAISAGIWLLAPLAVVPERQNRGIGGRLIKQGMDRLAAWGAGLVFVLGYPEYYRRHGFNPAGELGFEPPYPIAERNAEAWMVQALQTGIIGHHRGTLVCADKLDEPRYWQE